MSIFYDKILVRNGLNEIEECAFFGANENRYYFLKKQPTLKKNSHARDALYLFAMEFNELLCVTLGGRYLVFKQKYNRINYMKIW